MEKWFEQKFGSNPRDGIKKSESFNIFSLWSLISLVFIVSIIVYFLGYPKLSLWLSVGWLLLFIIKAIIDLK